jgi:hypothetical protein
MSATNFIHCPHCEAQVQAEVLAERESPAWEDMEPTKYVFLACTHCGTSMVGFSEWEPARDERGSGWGKLLRQWPEVNQQIHRNIPAIVRRSLEEAERCRSAKAYTACAVMVGRAIEGMCKDKVGAKYLGDGLKKLKAQGFIEEKLFQWGEALRTERNIGAHAGTELVSWQNARDALDFAHAMAEYVYVLDEKYKEWVARRTAPR